jgi:uncharacterized delta-60 repeat protein
MSTILKTIMIISIFISFATANEEKKATKPELKFTWKSTFGGSKKEIATSVVALEDGNVAVLGTCRSMGHGREDLCVIGVNQKGSTIWKRAFGGKKRDLSTALTRTSDGNLVAVGHGQSFNKNGDFDAYIVKLTPKGEMLWQRAFGGDENENANGVAPTKDGGVIVVGTTESYGKGNKDIYLLKLDKDGIKEWQKTLGGKKDDIAYAITPSSDGNFIIAGTSDSYSKDNFDFYVTKISPDGKQIWAKAYGEDKKDIFRAITPTPDGGCVVAGETESYKSKHSDMDVMKLDKDGEQVWHQLFGFKSIEYATGVTSTPEGGYLVVGTTKSMGHGKYDFYTLELDKDGHLIWGNLYGGGSKDIAHAVARTTRNSFVVVGETKSYGNGDRDFFMIDLLKR